MEKSLAKYIFNGETLYSLKQIKAPIPEKKEVQIANGPAPKVEKVEAPSSLVDAQVAQEIEEKQATQEVKVFSMKTPFLFVFTELNDTDRDFLLKIVQALGLSFTKVDLLEEKNFPFLDYKETIYANKVQKILFFGEKTGKDFRLKLNLEPYKDKTLKNIQFLLVDDLKTVSANKNNEKRRLWELLQGMFS